MWNRTEITKMLGLEYPIIQGPFGGSFSSTNLVAVVSNLGGMGSFGLNSYSPEEIIEIDKEIKSKTNKIYALNLWVPLKNDPVNQYTEEDFEAFKEVFSPIFEKYNLPIPQFKKPQQPNFDDKIESILKAKPPVVSFIFGVPGKEIIQELNKSGIKIIGTATSVAEAKLIEASGIDVVVASGMEAGGHRPSFLDTAQNVLKSTQKLVAEIVGQVNIPVVAAGGISDAHTMASHFRSGASAVQIGTAFLATKESNATELHKSKLLSDVPLKTELTNVFTGRLARALENEFSKFYKNNGDAIAPYPLQSSFLSPLRKAFLVGEQYDQIAFWSGQPSSTLKYHSAEKLFYSLANEMNAIG